MVHYPISANLYWRVERGRVRVSDEATAYKAHVAFIWKMLRRPMLATGPVEVSMLLHPKTTKSGAANLTRIDLDNALKIALDALNGVAFTDDRQVMRLYAAVVDPVEGGGLSVKVEPA